MAITEVQNEPKAGVTFAGESPDPNPNLTTTEERVMGVESPLTPGGITLKARVVNDQTFYDIATRAIYQALSVANTPFPTLNLPDSGFVGRAYDNLVNQFTVSDQQETEAKQRFRQAGNDEIAAEGEKALAQVQRNRADQDRAQQLAGIAQYFADMFGVGTNSARIAAKALLQQQLEDQADASEAAIHEKQSVSLLDNPLAWIGNQVTLPGEIAAHNSLAGRANALRADLDASIASARSAEEYNAKTIPTITAMQEEAANRQTLAQGVLLQKQREQQLAEQDYRFATADLANRISLYDAASKEGNRALEESKLEWTARVSAVQHATSEAERLLRVASLTDILQDRLALGAALEKYDLDMGKPYGTTTVATYNRMRKDEQEAVMSIIAGNPGTTPADAFNTIRGVGGPGPAASAQFKQAYGLSRNMEIAISTEEGFKQQTTKEARAAYVAKRMNEEYDKLQQNPNHDPKNNIFHEVSVTTMLKADPVFAQSQMGKILEPFNNSPTPPDTATIIETFRKAANGDNALAAAMISQYYAKNVQLRDRVSNFDKIGVKPNGTYYFNQDVGSIMGIRRITTNLTNPSAVLNMLNSMSVGEKTLELRNANPMMP